MNSVFITGTDTGIGKTVLAGALLGAARARGIKAVPMKPVQTGCERIGDDLVAPDLEFALQFVDRPFPPEDRALMAPYLFEPACSPHLAAKLAGAAIDPLKIRTAFNDLRERHDSVIVEGAGGLLVPVRDHKTMLDLVSILGLPVILAARPRLGTLNHTLLSLNELRRAGIKTIAVVFVQSDPGELDVIEKDNRITIEQIGEVPVLGPLPFLESLDPDTVLDAAAPVTTRLLEMLA